MIVGAIASTLILYNGVVDRVGSTREFVSLDIGSLLGPVQRTLALLAIGAGGRTRIFSTGLPQYGDVATARRGRGADTAKPRYRPESHRGCPDPLAGHDLANSSWRRRAKLNEERGY